MNALAKGMLVRHASLGLGKVVALEPGAVHVFFGAQGTRLATKLRLPMALSLLSAAEEPDPWSSGPGFALDTKSGRYARAGMTLSHAEAVDRFFANFPGGFRDEQYLAGTRAGRAARWRRAHEQFVEKLGGGRGPGLLAAGDDRGALEAAVAVERGVLPLLPPPVRGSFAHGLREPERARPFLAALFALAAPDSGDAASQGAFETLAAAAADLPVTAVRGPSWTATTLLPFVARPEAYPLLHARFALEVGPRLGLDLPFRPEPNWATYSAMLEWCSGLLERLRPLGARDFVDLEVFLQVAAARSPSAKAAAARGAPGGELEHH